jgi:hypothetical protein
MYHFDNYKALFSGCKAPRNFLAEQGFFAADLTIKVFFALNGGQASC